MATLHELKIMARESSWQHIIGKTAIVGIWQLYMDEPVTATQDFGKIIQVGEMLVLQTEDGREVKCPITPTAIIPAPRGTYRLRMTDQIIVDPDFLLSWRLDLEDEIEDSQWQANSAPHIYSIVGWEWEYEHRHDPDYEKELIEKYGDRLIGQTAIVGIRHYHRNANEETLVDQKQVYGVIARVSVSEGVVLHTKDGREVKLPPMISMLQPAPDEEYTLQSTGETVYRPDFLAQWKEVR